LKRLFFYVVVMGAELRRSNPGGLYLLKKGVCNGEKMLYSKDMREEFISRNLLGISRLLSRMIPAPPEGRAFLVGGVVRDIVCLAYGPPDLLDIDLCFEGDVLKWSSLISEKCSLEVVFEPRFKTARFWLSSGGKNLHLDIAMARSETYQSSGSLPVVAPASCLKDLERRDFSINAMAWPLGEIEYPCDSLIDPFGGRSDSLSGVLRVLHSKSFQDDPTRIFRGFRLLSRLSFQWEIGTQSLLDEAIFQKSIFVVSGVRIRKEFLRVFLEKDPVDVLKRLYQSGLMKAMTPESVWSESLEGSFSEAAFLSRVFFGGEMSSLLPLNWDSVREWCGGESFFYLAILKGLCSKDLERVIGRLGLAGKIGEVLKTVLLDPLSFSQKDYRPEAFLRHVFRHLLEAGSDYDPMNPLNRSDRRKNLFLALDVLSGKTGRELFLSGRDLIRMGIPPGKKIGEILRGLAEEVREGRITSRPEAIHWVRKEVLRSGL